MAESSNQPETKTKKRTYEVRSPVEHDLKRYEIGKPITLDDEAAAPLLDCGAIGEPKKEESAKS